MVSRRVYLSKLVIVFVTGILALGRSEAAVKMTDLGAMAERVAQESGKQLTMPSKFKAGIFIYGKGALSPQREGEAVMLSLAMNQYAFVERADGLAVVSTKQARQSDLLAVTTLPTLGEERFVSYRYTLKNLSTDDVIKGLRILPSKDGDLLKGSNAKELVLNDFVSALYRADALLRVLDGAAQELRPDASISAEGLVTPGDEKIDFNFAKAPIEQLLQKLATISSKTLIVDPAVGGKVTAKNAQKISKADAFRSALAALSESGVSTTVQGDFIRVQATRNIERANLEVLTELPKTLESRPITFVYRAKAAPIETLYKSVTGHLSKNGEVVFLEAAHSLVITDSMPNVSKMLELIRAADVPKQ